jgi:cytochrome c
LAALVFAPWSSAQLDADAAPKLGTVISAEQEAGLDLIASAEGGLPDGKGGAANQALVGGSMQSAESPLRTVGSYWPHATTLFDFIRRAMPANAPKTLSDTEVYQLVAYVLYMNGVVDQYKIIDADSLPSIRMPNAEGFVDASGAH